MKPRKPFKKITLGNKGDILVNKDFCFLRLYLGNEHDLFFNYSKSFPRLDINPRIGVNEGQEVYKHILYLSYSKHENALF